MRIAGAALLLALHGLTNSAAAEPPRDNRVGRTERDQSLTVMTWNLEWFYDDQASDNYSELAKQKSAPNRADWNWKRDGVATSIARQRPTIAALQEVENRRVLWYLSRALTGNHQLEYHELGIESRDHYTEQDVGFLYRPPVDVLKVSQGMYPKRLRSTNQYFDLTKHILAVFEFPIGQTTERITIINVHMRATAEAESKRRRQARLLHFWIADAVRNGANVIALGDFNTELQGDRALKSSDVGIASGLETRPSDDDLIDLNLRLPRSGRMTHLTGGQYDRILCSQSLITDDLGKPDLVFSKIEVLYELAIQGERDDATRHWEQFWNIPENQRDLSDHYPVLATFAVR